MLLLSQGTLVDGTGAEPVISSVLLDHGEIIAVESSIAAPDCDVIDCRGLTITPGFLDLHSHSDLQVLDRRQEKLKQGVTAEVVGNCGFSPFPFAGEDAASLQDFGSGILGKPDGWGWRSARDYFDALHRSGASGEAFPLVGHGSLRIAVHGQGQELLTSHELDRLDGLVDDCLAAGCVGLSTGLMYAPGSSANDKELLHLCKAVAKRDKLYASHIRSYSAGLVNAVEEQIGLAERSGCRLQISHLQASGRQNWHLLEPALERIEAARARGIDVEFDIYPYQCGSTVLTQLLPQWALDGGTPALMDRLASGPIRAKLEAELNDKPRGYWADVTISSVNSKENANVIGQTVSEMAALRETGEGNAVLTLLEEENAAVNIISFNQSEENLRRLIAHNLCSVITDGFYVKGNPHPRLHGTYPELLGTLVRQRKWISLAEAVHKSSAKPAARVRLPRRGIVKPGYLADLAIFDAGQVQSRATYAEPAIDPLGIALVLKRGEIAFRSATAPAVNSSSAMP